MKVNFLMNEKKANVLTVHEKGNKQEKLQAKLTPYLQKKF